MVRGHGAVINTMYFVYILISLKDNNFYIGFTTNVENRLKDHNAGRNTSTKYRRPFELIYYEAYYSKTDAQRRERYFKTTKGKATLKQMLRQAISDLSVSEGKAANNTGLGEIS